MSNPNDPFINSFNIQTIKAIDQLDLSIMQKHHLRILAHCLIILKSTYLKQNSYFSFESDKALREWCNNYSQKFNDQKFNDTLYVQLISTAKKLDNFAKRLNKNLHDLEIDDLALLVQENSENKP